MASTQSSSYNYDIRQVGAKFRVTERETGLIMRALDTRTEAEDFARLLAPPRDII